MHEMSLTQGIVEICLQHAAHRQILTVVLEIGRLSGVVPEAIQFCFEACSKDTPLDGAHLQIIETSGTGRCIECCAEQPVESRFSPCRHCGGYAVQLLTGDEMRVREIEIAD